MAAVLFPPPLVLLDPLELVVEDDDEELELDPVPIGHVRSVHTSLNLQTLGLTQ